jgi:hypothetical protein
VLEKVKEVVEGKSVADVLKELQNRSEYPEAVSSSLCVYMWNVTLGRSCRLVWPFASLQVDHNRTTHRSRCIGYVTKMKYLR